ncbi:MAG: type II toxin-antitoxin system VapC family toxin [Candidatus Eremiobacteraeota bacterium]|nr:type II toxin-antitoxin system VapC family toxin [Candidatus Eremiobacteraeota bacterium]
MSWLFEDERDDVSVAMAVEVRERGAAVPVLFRWETQSALIASVRQKRISYEQAVTHLHSFDKLHLRPDEFIANASFSTGFDLARRFALTPYDAAYIELSLRTSLPLMTRDKKLASVAAELNFLWAAPE